MNVSEKYNDGISLKGGTYTIKVTSKGYYDKIGDVVLKSDVNINISLEKKKVQQVENFANKPRISSSIYK